MVKRNCREVIHLESKFALCAAGKCARYVHKLKEIKFYNLDDRESAKTEQWISIKQWAEWSRWYLLHQVAKTNSLVVAGMRWSYTRCRALRLRTRLQRALNIARGVRPAEHGQCQGNLTGADFRSNVTTPRSSNSPFVIERSIDIVTVAGWSCQCWVAWREVSSVLRSVGSATGVGHADIAAINASPSHAPPALFI